MVHQLIALLLEVVRSNEDLVVRFNIRDSVRKGLLGLTGKVPHRTVQYAELDLEAEGRRAPLLLVQEVENSLQNLEVSKVWVTWNDDHQPKHRPQHFSHLLELP